MGLYYSTGKFVVPRRFISMLAMFVLSISLIMGFPILAEADGVRTGDWIVVGKADSGGPANPSTIVADKDGNVYVISDGAVSKLPVGETAWQKLTQTGLDLNPEIITVDKNGTVYVTNAANKIRKLPKGGTQWVSIDNGGISGAQGIAVDDNLNLYLTTGGISGNYFNACVKLQNGTWSVIRNMMRFVCGIAVDSQGNNIYVTTQKGSDGGKDEVLKWSYGSWGLAGDSIVNMPQIPGSVAVDKSGNVHVIDLKDYTVKVWMNGQWRTIGGNSPSGPQMPTYVAVDGYDNVYVTDTQDNTIWKLQSPATKLVWTVQPGNGTAGRPFDNPPQVALMDAYDNVQIGDSTHMVTLSLDSDNGATMSNITAKLQNGIATFNSLIVNKVGSSYTLKPSCDLYESLEVQVSNPFSMISPPAPVVTGVSPASGLGGTFVTITGDNLTAASVVEFGSAIGVNIVVNSDESITVTAPAQSAGTVDLKVTTPGGTSAINPAVRFTYNQPGAWTNEWMNITGGTTFAYPNGIAAYREIKDGQEILKIFVVDSNDHKLKMWADNTWTDITPAIGLHGPNDVAVYKPTNSEFLDVYIAQTYKIIKNGAVLTDFSVEGNPFRYFIPLAIDVDKNGDIYAVGGSTLLKYSGGNWSRIIVDGGFSDAQGMAINSQGDIYVSEYNNSIKVLIHSTGAWSSLVSGGFNRPHGMAVDSIGNLYVADSSNHVVKVLQVGATQWITMGGMYYPSGVATDSLGNLYVTATDLLGNDAVLKKQAPATQLVWETQPADGYTGHDLEPFPVLVLKGANGNVITSDNSDTVSLSLYSNNGAVLEGTTTVAMVNGVAHFVDISVNKAGSGYILVPSCSLQGISIANSSPFNITDSTTPPPPPMAWAGNWTTIGNYDNGFRSRTAIAVGDVARDGFTGKAVTVFVVDSNKNSLKFKRDGVWYDVTNTLNYPRGVAVDNNGNVYVANTDSKCIWMEGITVGGTLGFFTDDVAVDKDNNLYTCGTDETGKAYIKKYSSFVWSDIAYRESFSRPRGVAVDNKGNVYATDVNSVKMLPSGANQWKTIGTGFGSLFGVAVDDTGNVYVADNGRGEIRVLRAGGTEWASIVKGGTYGVDDVAVDNKGNVYVAYNEYIYMHQAPAAKLEWQTQPSGGMGRTTWVQQPVLCLKDINGDPMTGDSISTVTVSLSPNNGATLDGTSSTATVVLNKGIAAFSNLKADKAGTYTLKVSSSIPGIDCPQSASFVITIGEVDAGKSEIKAGKSTVTADDIDSSAIIVTLKDAYGNPISGKTVELNKANGSSSISPSSTTTNEDGEASFTIKSTKAELVTYTATDTTDSLNITGSIQVSFVSGPVNSTKSAVKAGKSTVIADGTDNTNITVTLKDANDNPVSGKTVTLTQTGGNSNIAPPSTASDAAGIAAFTVNSSKAAVITYTAEAGGVVLAETPQVTFKAGEAKKLVVGVNAVQKAGEPFEVTVTVKDANDNTVLDYTGTVALSTNNGNSPGGTEPLLPQNYTFKPTDNGEHSLSGVTLYNAALSTVTATDTNNGAVTGVAENIAVSPGDVNDTNSTIAAASEEITVGGSNSTDITVTLKDAYSNPISGKNVELQPSGGSSNITPSSTATDIQGIAIFKAENNIAEEVVYKPVVAGTALTKTVKVTYKHGELKKLSVVAAVTPKAGEAFGVTVTAQDEYGNTVTEYAGTVQLSSTDAKAVLPGSHIYEAIDKGSYTFAGMIMKTSGTQTVTATDTENSAITGNSGSIPVESGTSYTGQSTIAADKPNVIADGIEESTITVTLMDDYGNLVGGKNITLSPDSPASIISPANADTDAAGKAVFKVKSTKAEIVTYKAMADGADLGKSIQVTFKHGAVKKLNVTASGTPKAGEAFKVAVTAQDEYGNTVTDYTGTINFSTNNGNSPNNTAPALPADYTFTALDNGVHSFENVVMYNAAISTLTAIDTLNNTVTGTAAGITVNPGMADTEKSEAVVSNSGIKVGSTNNSTITVTLKDKYDNIASGKTVTLDQGSGSSNISPANTVTNGAGTASFTVSSNKAETVIYKVMVDGKDLNKNTQVTFEPGVVKKLDVTASGTPKAGEAVKVTVTAQDEYGNTATGYAGTINFSTNNGNSPDNTAPALPVDYTFTASDKGIHDFDVTLYNAAVSSLTVTDTLDNTITGTAGSITVEHGQIDPDASEVSVSNPEVVADGNYNSIITVLLKDHYGNSISGKKVALEQGNGSSSITTSNDTSDLNGKAVFSVGSTKAEEVTYSVLADSITLTATGIVNFIPGSLNGLQVSVPSTQVAGKAFSVTIAARDSNGNTVTGYTGTVSFSTDNVNSPSGMAPSLPDDYTFTSADAGVHIFSDEITLFSAEVSKVTVVDTVYGTYTGTSSIGISPGAASVTTSEISASNPTVAVGGNKSDITVTLKDEYGNPISGEPVALSQSGSSVITPASVASDANGIAAFTVTSTKAEEVEYTAMVKGANATQSVSIKFEPGPVDGLQSTMTASKKIVGAGGADSSVVTVTLKDAYGNPVSGETVTLEQGAGSSNITAINAVSGIDGKATFTVSNANVEEVTYIAAAGGVSIKKTITISFLPFHTVKVTANPSTGGTASGDGSFAEGSSVTVKASPGQGYRFSNWTEDGSQVSNSASYTFTIGTSDRVIVANFEPVRHSDDDTDKEDGNSGGSRESETQQIPDNTPVPADNNTGNTSITASSELDSSTGTVKAEVTSEALSSAFNTAAAGSDGIRTVAVEIPKIEGAKAYESTLPASFAASGDSTRKVELKTEMADVTVPGNMLSAANAAGAQNVSLTIAAADKSKLAADLQTQIGNKPIIELNLEIDGQKITWSNEGAPVTVSIPYTPTAEELRDPEHITIWYIDGSGRAISVPSGRYDPTTGKVTFSTTHFSKYAVVFVQKSFSDISSYGWAKRQIEVLASKGIIYSTSDNTYSPAANVTRADYLAMLVRTLGLSADFDESFADIKPDMRCYNEIGIARKLGITTGIGNNKFNPDSPISRQDMMVMTVKALGIAKKITSSTDSTNLDKFADKALIASYAAGSVAAMVEAGFIEGSGISIRPLSYTSRAEAAVLLYRIYNFKY